MKLSINIYFFYKNQSFYSSFSSAISSGYSFSPSSPSSFNYSGSIPNKCKFCLNNNIYWIH